MTTSARNSVSIVDRPAPSEPRARTISARSTQSVHQIRDRVWKAKIRKVERIEAEEDRMWGLIAERIASDPNEESIPWEVVKRELGLERSAQ